MKPVPSVTYTFETPRNRRESCHSYGRCPDLEVFAVKERF